jgi:hypothetical protein
MGTIFCMMIDTSPARIRQDCRRIRQTLLKLAAPRLILRAVVSIVVILVWLYVASLILAFGAGMTYAWLGVLSPQVASFLTPYLLSFNPYLWWIVVGIWTIIVFLLHRGWLRASMESARGIAVEPDTLGALVSELSAEVIGVMRWCWGTREEPFSIGDLERTLSETRHGRIAKIAMVHEQEALMREPPGVAPVANGSRSVAAPVAPAAPLAHAAYVPPAPGEAPREHVEPRIGPPR